MNSNKLITKSDLQFMQTLSGEEKLIQDARTATNKHIAEHDLESLINYWLDDIVIIRGNGNILPDKKTATETWQNIFNKEPNVSYIRQPDEIIISEDGLLAWEKGTWKGINTINSNGNYAAMWRKHNVVWKLQAELYVLLG